MMKFFNELKNSVDKILAILQQKREPAPVLTSDLMRSILGSIKIDDIQEPEFANTEEKTVYLAEAVAALRRFIEPRCKKLIAQQKDFLADQAEGQQVIFGRGSMNGIKLVLESFEKDLIEYQELTKPPEPFDRHKILNALGADEYQKGRE